MGINFFGIKQQKKPKVLTPLVLLICYYQLRDWEDFIFSNWQDVTRINCTECQFLSE